MNSRFETRYTNTLTHAQGKQTANRPALTGSLPHSHAHKHTHTAEHTYTRMIHIHSSYLLFFFLVVPRAKHGLEGKHGFTLTTNKADLTAAVVKDSKSRGTHRHARTHADAQTHTYTHKRTRARTHTNARRHARARTQTHTQTHTERHRQ